MNMSNIITGMVVVALAFTIASAEAKTMAFTEVYTDVYLVQGDTLTVFNDDVVAHSITSVDRTAPWSFDSGEIAGATPDRSGGTTSMGFAGIGDYAFFDSRNPSLTGVIHVVSTLPVEPTLSISQLQVEAGDSVLLSGKDLGSNSRIELEIISPDASVYQSITVTSTDEGTIQIPIQTSRTDKNGTYKIFTVGKTSLDTAFRINGGVSADNPLVETPVIQNSTQPSVEPSLQPSTEPSAQPNLVQPIISSNQTSLDRAYIVAQIEFWTRMLALIDSISLN